MGPRAQGSGLIMDGTPRVRRSNGNVSDERTRRAKHFIWHNSALHQVFAKIIITIKIYKGHKGAPTEGATALRPHPDAHKTHWSLIETSSTTTDTPRGATASSRKQQASTRMNLHQTQRMKCPRWSPSTSPLNQPEPRRRNRCHTMSFRRSPSGWYVW